MKLILIGANGYIGSRVFEELNNYYEIYPIDNLLVKRNQLSFVKKFSYQDLSSEYLSRFDVCLWLSGHSSVKQSMDNPLDAFKNNTTGLIELSNKFNGTIIYASSGSVYNNSNNNLCDEKTLIYSATNIYDFSKFVTDEYFKMNNDKFISLRFGTVNGSSSSFRQELMLNKMSIDSIKNKKIFVSNQNAYRPVLFIEDLVNSIRVLLKNHKDLRGNIFNLCSINHTIGEYANFVGNFFNSQIEILEDTKSYSFRMSNDKFKRMLNFSFTNDVNKILNNLKTTLKK